jgi:large subunit ribosomal protein L2
MIKIYKYINSKAGRNNTGSITVRHRGAPKNKKTTINFINRINQFSSFTRYKDQNDYTTFVKLDSNNFYSFIISKNSTYPNRLYSFKPGTSICNIESFPGSGPKYVRSKYSRALVVRRLGTSMVIKIPSGEIRKFRSGCFAYTSLNKSHVTQKFFAAKAGYNRNLGYRPSVRGCAINPVDHPHGGRTGESRPSVSPWAKLTKGYRTRKVPKNKSIVILSVQELKNRAKKK